MSCEKQSRRLDEPRCDTTFTVPETTTTKWGPINLHLDHFPDVVDPAVLLPDNKGDQLYDAMSSDAMYDWWIFELDHGFWER